MTVNTLTGRAWLDFLEVLPFSVSMFTLDALRALYSRKKSLAGKFYSDADKDKIIFKAIEKYRYGLENTVSKHLNDNLQIFCHPHYFLHLSGLQHSVILPPQPYGLPLNFKTLPQSLQDAGKKDLF